MEELEITRRLAHHLKPSATNVASAHHTYELARGVDTLYTAMKTLSLLACHSGETALKEFDDSRKANVEG